MPRFKSVNAKEVWIHSKPVGFIVEQWFYPAPGIQLGAWELQEIIEAMNHGAPEEIKDVNAIQKLVQDSVILSRARCNAPHDLIDDPRTKDPR